MSPESISRVLYVSGAEKSFAMAEIWTEVSKPSSDMNEVA